eukprot:6182591-Pleurochrysis_carterae.AAC.2
MPPLACNGTYTASCQHEAFALARFSRSPTLRRQWRCQCGHSISHTTASRYRYCAVRCLQQSTCKFTSEHTVDARQHQPSSGLRELAPIIVFVANQQHRLAVRMSAATSVTAIIFASVNGSDDTHLEPPY